MKYNDFKFLIWSPYDYENLVCEIEYKGIVIADISLEKDELTLEIYPSLTDEWLNAPLEDVQDALEAAKKYYLCG